MTLAVLQGDIEHAMHERFADCHSRGEWFMPDIQMRVWIASL